MKCRTPGAALRPKGSRRAEWGRYRIQTHAHGHRRCRIDAWKHPLKLPASRLDNGLLIDAQRGAGAVPRTNMVARTIRKTSSSAFVSRWQNMCTPLPVPILGDRSESKRRELEVKILALALGHCSSMPFRLRHGAIPADHVD